MALAYPEGECFFRRSALDSGSYHASNPKDFYSHMMVEFIWNRWSYHGSEEAMSREQSRGQGHRHPRSSHKIVRGTLWDTDYGAWTHISFMYGPAWNKMKRRVQHNLCTNGNRFKRLEQGGSNESWFMFMPMPTSEERWVWIDMLTYIRAIYLPVAHTVSKDHDDLCSFVQVNFALDRTVKFWTDERRFSDVKTDKVLGLQMNVHTTVALDVTGLIQLLSLPRQLRRDNCYNLKLVKMHKAGMITPVRLNVSKSFSDGNDISWLQVAKGNFGLDLMWQPPQKSTWQENFIRNVLTIAIGFVPGVGPLLQIAFSVGWTLVTEEDPKAAYGVLKSLCPGVELTENVVSDLSKGAVEIRSYLPDGWQDLNLKLYVKPIDESAKLAPRPIEQMDAMVPMLLQKEVLDATGNSPDEEQKKEGDDVGDCSLVLENDELVLDLEDDATDVLDTSEDTLKSVADRIT